MSLRRSLVLATLVAFGAIALTPPRGAYGAPPREAQGREILPTLAPQVRTPAIAVLVWHDVLPSKAVYFDTTTAELASEFATIARGGYHVVSLDALRDRLLHGAPLPPKPLVLTFDDDGAGIYRYAFPLLRRYRFAATLFVHTNFVGKTTSKAHNTWEQLAEMERSGLISVQSLTANHPPDLTKLPDADVTHEFALSKRSLGVRLHRPVYAVVYPYDVYDARVEALAARAGYTLGFTEDHGNAGDSPSTLEIHRYSMTVPERFAQALAMVASAP